VGSIDEDTRVLVAFLRDLEGMRYNEDNNKVYFY